MLPEPVTATATASTQSVRSKTGMTRVGIGLVIGGLAYQLPLNASAAVLLPAMFARLAPDNKVTLLGLATGITAVVGLFAAVIAGALSDRTRSRFGSRTPWIVMGGVGMAIILLALSFAQDVTTIIVLWALISIPINMLGAAMTAIIADRVPSRRRGTLSAVVGLSLLMGAALGPLVGAQFLSDYSTGFRVLAVVALILPVVAVIIAPDYPNTHDPRARLDLAEVRRAFAFPRKAPDFYWALWGRLILVTGYFMINTFQLYILTDYVGLTEEQAGGVIATNAILFAVAALVSMLVGGIVSDRIGRRKPLVFGASVLFVISIAAPLLFPTVGGMIAFAVVGGLGFGMYISTDSALMTEVLPSSDTRGKDLGILNVANTGGQAIAPLATSAIVAIGVGFAPVFVAAIVVCAVGAVFILPIRSVR